MGWSTGLLEQCLEELVLNWKGIFACLLCDGSEASWQGCPLCWEAPLDCPTPRVNRVRVSLLYPLQVCVLINTGITPSFALEGRHNLACLRGSADPFLRPPHHHTSRTAHGLLPKQPAVCFLATHIQVGLETFFYHLCLHCKLFKTHVFWGCCLTSPWVCNSHLIFVDSIFMGLWADQTSSPCPKTPSLVHCADTGSVSHSFLEFPRGFSVIAAAGGVCGGTCSTDTAEKKLKYLRQQEGRGAYLLDSSPSQTRQALTKLRVDMQLDSNMENITPASSCPAVTPLCCWFRHSVGLGVTSVSLSLLGPSWHSNSGCRKLCCVAALKTSVQICITAKITWLVMSH